ncbi:MAG: YbhB/YbcL family Raf kinase inhibitor-like protein [Thermoanaerobaculia bacterium]
MRLESPAFPDAGEIPREHSRDGADTSPPLLWSGVPAGTATLALVCDDPDAPRGTWVHWVLYDLPPSLPGLPAGVAKTERLPGGGVHGRTDYGDIGWGGPAPPCGHGTHHYAFRLYALDTVLELPPGATKARLEAAMKGHVLAEAKLTGTYRRD